MLNNIKSTYFAKVIFSNINDKRQLELVKYNKNLQKKLNISITNYKIFYGKYIIYESDESDIKVKEYFCYNDKLIYEGDYLKNKRHGIGIEYDNYHGKIKFIGEYLNGKKNGKCEEYYYNGNILFEGEYLNDHKWNGKGYDKDKNIVYEINEGKGFIKEYYSLNNKVKYIGEYLNGERNGKGKEFDYNENLVFEGEYSNGKKWNGKGYGKNGDIIYELKNGKGFVKEYYYFSDKLYYKGGYLNGEKNGKSKNYYNNTIIFEGEYFNGKRNGKGKEYDFNGNLIFEGEYLYDYKIKGKEYLKGKLEYEGDYLFNKKWNGKGYDKNRNIIYEIKNGNGKVKEYYYNGNLEFEGEYINGRRNGKGKEYYFDGKLRYEGDYFNGKIMNDNFKINFDNI